MTGMGSLRESPESDPRWEVGSHFEAIGWSPTPQGSAAAHWDVLFATGRGALAAVVRTGVSELGWQVLYVPSYYCGPAYPPAETPIQLRPYQVRPGSPRIRIDESPGAALLLPAYFGQPPPLVPGGPALILDLTHDPWAPWADDLPAAYRIASLRKTLPVACGAGISAGAGLPVPAPQTLSALGRELIARRIDAMARKASYRRGDEVDRAAAVHDLARSEEDFGAFCRQAADAESAHDLSTMPVHEWRSIRQRNVATLGSAIRVRRGLVVQPTAFATVLLLPDRAARDSLRSWLIAHRVFPSVLWEQDHPFADAGGIDFAARHLVLAADFRYDRDDMLRVAGLVNAWSQP